MKKCEKCGAESSDDAVFCRSCGAAFADQTVEANKGSVGGTVETAPGALTGSVSAAAPKASGKNGNKKVGIIVFAAFILTAIVAVLLVVLLKGGSGGGYRKAVTDTVEAWNRRSTDFSDFKIRGFQDSSFVPVEQLLVDIVKESGLYGEGVEDYFVTYYEALENGGCGHNFNVDGYGEDWRVSVEFEDEEKLDRDELEEWQEWYEDRYDAYQQGFMWEDEELYEAWAAGYAEKELGIELSDSEIQRIMDAMSNMVNSLEDRKVQEGYKADLTIEIQGEDGDKKWKMRDAVFLNVDGQWYLADEGSHDRYCWILTDNVPEELILLDGSLETYLWGVVPQNQEQSDEPGYAETESADMPVDESGAIELEFYEDNLGIFYLDAFTEYWAEITNYDSSWTNLHATSSDPDIVGAWIEGNEVYYHAKGTPGRATITISADNKEDAVIEVSAYYGIPVDMLPLDHWNHDSQVPTSTRLRVGASCWDCYPLLWYYTDRRYWYTATSRGHGQITFSYENENLLGGYTEYTYCVMSEIPWDMACYLGLEGYSKEDDPDFDFSKLTYDIINTGYTSPVEGSPLYRAARYYGDEPVKYYLYFDYDDVVNGTHEYVFVEFDKNAMDVLDRAAISVSWKPSLDDFEDTTEDTTWDRVFKDVASHIFNYVSRQITD